MVEPVQSASIHAAPTHGAQSPPGPNGRGTAQNDREPLWRDVLGDHLRATRHDRGETLTDVADRAGVSPQYLSEVERGRKEPSSEMIAAIGGALGLTLIDLTRSVSQRLGAQRAPRAATPARGVFALAA